MAATAWIPTSTVRLEVWGDEQGTDITTSQEKNKKTQCPIYDVIEDDVMTCGDECCGTINTGSAGDASKIMGGIHQSRRGGEMAGGRFYLSVLTCDDIIL